MTTSSFSGTVSLKRGLDLVRLLAESGPLTINEIAEKTRIRRDSVERIVNTLLSEGFLELTAAGVGFQPGRVVRDLAESYQKGTPALEIARSILQGISGRRGVTIKLLVSEGENVLCLMVASANRVSLADAAAGRPVSMKQSAGGVPFPTS